jgi:hypothetical protein
MLRLRRSERDSGWMYGVCEGTNATEKPHPSRSLRLETAGGVEAMLLGFGGLYRLRRGLV